MIKIVRYYTPIGTFGDLSVYGTSFRCKTVEPPWMNNEPYVSCIPEGVYRVKMSYYNSGGYFIYEVVGVPDRSDIKIHIGNTIDDSTGCIMPGVKFGVINNQWAVKHSRTAFNEFMAAMNRVPESTVEIGQFRPKTIYI